MARIILRIYDFLRQRKPVLVCSLIAVTIILAALVSRLEYDEDIMDFLPLDDTDSKSLTVYQDIAGADKVIAVFRYADGVEEDPGKMTEAIEHFVVLLSEADTAAVVGSVLSQVDIDKMLEIQDFVYDHIPYFLTDADYHRIDSLLAQPDYISNCLAENRQLLMLPSGGMLIGNIQRDPLNLFIPLMTSLQERTGGLMYETYDGYIFSPDMQRGLVLISSPFGSSETSGNARLVSVLECCADSLHNICPDIDVHFTGSPVIAVANSTQIKRDSVTAVSISAILIVVLLFVTFRRVRNLLLIVLSIGWGWLFAMGGLALLHDHVSIIVIGISSVILGIAVNYPLHYIAHLGHTTDKRKALREIVTPLIVGNITTVGAFLTLVPLESVALRDLGLYASFLLIGTIVFSVIYLPHLARPVTTMPRRTFIDKLCEVSIENKRWVVCVVMVLTVVLAWYSRDTKFDSNMSHINYMTAQQREDMEYFSREVMGGSDNLTLYAVAEGTNMDEALSRSEALQLLLDSLSHSAVIEAPRNCHQFVCSKAEQDRRLALWRDFVRRYNQLPASVSEEGCKVGFANDSFDLFADILERQYNTLDPSAFDVIITDVMPSHFSHNKHTDTYSVVSTLDVGDRDTARRVEDLLHSHGFYGFDLEGMNSSLADNLSDNFNYIGWACGFIVFVFLWISLGSIELAVLSFIPMAVSWLWILGLMAIFGIQFNIVNVILATFIFGQGDDYTIFMTEGVCYEYAYRRKMLASYKHAIILSSLIMFIGIGSLIVAKHPALLSLAEVTIAGMFSVVLMATLFPPLIYRVLIQRRGTYRNRPLSLRPVAAMAFSASVFFVQLLLTYVIGYILFEVLHHDEKYKLAFRRHAQRLFMYDLSHIPGVKYSIHNEYGEDFSRPAVIISNHQSFIDSAVLMSLSHKMVMISNNKVKSNLIIKRIYKWMGHLSIEDGCDWDMEVLRNCVNNGYSLVIFPEGCRNDRSSINRFHKGAFHLAEKLNIDIIPLMLHGLNVCVPNHDISVYSGSMTVTIGKRIKKDDAEWGVGYSERTRNIHKFYVREYARLSAAVETSAYFHDFIIDRYRYKGREITNSVIKNLRRHNDYSATIDEAPHCGVAVVALHDHGEFALLYALVHRERRVVAVMDDDEHVALLRYSAQGVADNLTVVAAGQTAEQLSMCSPGEVVVYHLGAVPDSLGRYTTVNVDA